MATMNVSLRGTTTMVREGEVKFTATDKVKLDNLQNYDDTKIVADIQACNSEHISIIGTLTNLTNRLAVAEQKLTDLSKTDIAVVTSAEDLAQPTKDLVITLAEPVANTKAVISGKSVEIKAAEVNSGCIQITTDGDVTVKNVVATGVCDKNTFGNAQLNVPKGKYVNISDSNISQTGYNGIEIGGTSAVKNVVIDNVQVVGALTNNGISIYHTEDGAVVTISNCTIKNCSNAVRLSNCDGGKLIVNLINCDLEWNLNPGDNARDYIGIIIFQDYTSKSADEAAANNLFGRDKVQINMIGCTSRGEAITFENIEDVCGSKTADQLFYVYRDKGGLVAFGDGSAYPVFSIDGKVYNA